MRTSPHVGRRLAMIGAVVLAHGASPALLLGQCTGWIPGQYRAGVTRQNNFTRTVSSSHTWAPSGPGSEVLVVTGPLDRAGGLVVKGLARFDGVNWEGFGAGLGHSTTSGPYGTIVIEYQGKLIVGGLFDRIDHQPWSGRIAAYNGQWWDPLMTGLNGTPSAAVIYQDKLLVAGGFSIAGNAAAWRLALWDGSNWAAFPGTTYGQVSALAVNGDDLYIGGVFTEAGGVAVNNVAHFDGVSWRDVGGGITSIGSPPVFVHGIAFFDGDLYISGTFSSAGGAPANGIARWDGHVWDALEGGISGTGHALIEHDGLLYVAGAFSTAGGEPARNIASWDGSQWSEVGGGINSVVHHLTSFAGELYAWGVFAEAGDVRANSAARWNGERWLPIGSGFSDALADGVVMFDELDEKLVAGGRFSLAGGCATSNIAQWDGAAWSAFGPGLRHTSTSALPTTLAAVTAGSEIIAGGFFNISGSQSLANLARWDGTAWQAHGTFNGSVLALVHHQGKLFSAGSFTNVGARVAVWDGVSWEGVGGGFNNVVNTLAVYNDDLYAGGNFTQADGIAAVGIARWDGTSWQSPGGGLASGRVHVLHVYDGRLVAGGEFQEVGSVAASHIASWDGANWASLGIGVHSGSPTAVRALTEYNGTLVVGGSFVAAGGVGSANLARWNGSSWAGFPGGVTGTVHSLRVRKDELHIGGVLTAAGGKPTSNWTRWSDAAVPSFAHSPEDQIASAGSEVVMTATKAWGYAVTHQWERNGEPIQNGFGGASAEGGIVHGAQGATLRIRSVKPSDAGEYRCVISGPCGVGISNAATLIVKAGELCYANCDQSTAAPILNVDDFTCFINAFAQAQGLPQALQIEAYANCDGSTAAPVLNVDDFTCFINAFAAGCK